MCFNTSIDNQVVILISMKKSMTALVCMLFLAFMLQGDTMPAEQEEEDSTIHIVTVDSTNLRFSPSTVTLVEGDSVRFFWSGQALPHNAVEANGFFDSGEPVRDLDYTVLFEIGSNGTYDFVCEPHEAFGMIGQLIVEPAPLPEPPTNETNNSQTNMSDDEMMPSISFVSTLTTVMAASLIMYQRRMEN